MRAISPLLLTLPLFSAFFIHTVHAKCEEEGRRSYVRCLWQEPEDHNEVLTENGKNYFKFNYNLYRNPSQTHYEFDPTYTARGVQGSIAQNSSNSSNLTNSTSESSTAIDVDALVTRFATNHDGIEDFSLFKYSESADANNAYIIGMPIPEKALKPWEDEGHYFCKYGHSFSANPDKMPNDLRTDLAFKKDHPDKHGRGEGKVEHGRSQWSECDAFCDVGRLFTCSCLTEEVSNEKRSETQRGLMISGILFTIIGVVLCLLTCACAAQGKSKSANSYNNAGQSSTGNSLAAQQLALGGMQAQPMGMQQPNMMMQSPMMQQQGMMMQQPDGTMVMVQTNANMMQPQMGQMMQPQMGQLPATNEYGKSNYSAGAHYAGPPSEASEIISENSNNSDISSIKDTIEKSQIEMQAVVFDSDSETGTSSTSSPGKGRRHESKLSKMLREGSHKMMQPGMQPVGQVQLDDYGKPIQPQFMQQPGMQQPGMQPGMQMQQPIGAGSQQNRPTRQTEWNQNDKMWVCGGGGACCTCCGIGLLIGMAVVSGLTYWSVPVGCSEKETLLGRDVWRSETWHEDFSGVHFVDPAELEIKK